MRQAMEARGVSPHYWMSNHVPGNRLTAKLSAFSVPLSICSAIALPPPPTPFPVVRPRRVGGHEYNERVKPLFEARGY